MILFYVLVKVREEIMFNTAFILEHTSNPNSILEIRNYTRPINVIDNIDLFNIL